MVFKLYDYQRNLIDQARKEIADKNVMIVSPPGSGKSVVISEVIKLATDKGGHVLFLVHRKELIEQIIGSLSAHGVNLDKVTALTVGKAKNRLGKLTKPTLIVTDEGHHGKASTYQVIYDYYSDVPRLGFTATPWRMSGAGFTDTYDVMVEGHTVEWLIANHRLAPYRYYSLPAIDVKKLKTRNGDYTNQSIDEAFGKAIFGNVVREYRKHADGQQAILYAHSIEASKSFADEFLKAGIQAVHADSKTPKKEREEIMQAFREGDIKVLCNVDLISEGFDVPDCTVTILCRPTKSLVLYLQQSIRSMRYKPEKTAIIIDNVLNWKQHGLPDDNHDWDAYFRGGWKKKNQANTIQAKECPECSAMWHLNVTVCEICGHDFGERERQEKERIEAELVLIEKEKARLSKVADQKFGSSLLKNWHIAKARASIKGGKPLYKLLFYYVGNTRVNVSDNDIIRMTGVSSKEYHTARKWVEKQKNKIITRY